MADGTVGVAQSASPDRLVDNEQLTVGANTVYRQRIELAGASSAEVTRVLNVAPAGTEYGVVTRNVPSGTQPVSATDGAQVTVGTTTDAEAAAGNGSLVALLKRLRTLLNGGLPAALGANGGLKIEGVASGTVVPVSGTVTGNQGTANSAANAWPAKVTDGTNVAAVKAASTAVAAADPALAVGIHPSSALPAGSNVIGALTANQSVNQAQVAGTATAVDSGTSSAGTQRVVVAGPATANILVGQVAQTSTTGAATVITIPINRTWVGTIAVVCDVSNAAASTVAGQALATIATTGASATPAAGTVLTCEARAGACAATGTVGDQGNVAIAVPMTISAGASALATVTLASTQAGTASRVAVTASGVLI